MAKDVMEIRWHARGTGAVTAAKHWQRCPLKICIFRLSLNMARKNGRADSML